MINNHYDQKRIYSYRPSKFPKCGNKHNFTEHTILGNEDKCLKCHAKIKSQCEKHSVT